MTYDYFYGQQAEMFAFYRVPKVLFTEDCFWNVSTDAKLLYGILLDRMNLSARNGWLDEEGRVYIIFTIEEIKGALGCAEKKAVKLLDELEKKCGLIERKRQGLGKPNLIYVKNFISGSVERQFLNCQKDNSGVVKNTIQELSKAQGNNTDTNYTDLSDTDPFFPSGFCGKEVDGTDEFARYYQYFYEHLSMDYLKQDYPYDHEIPSITWTSLRLSMTPLKFSGRRLRNMKKCIGIYMRLSQEDVDKKTNRAKDESNSIAAQRQLIKRHIEQNPYLSSLPQKEFCDDGFSGTNFERPDFQRMIDLIRAGEIHIVIVKDLSRFGRDYLEVGDYLEHIFPFLGVRMISINDQYDSERFLGNTAGMDIAFRNLIYDYYSKDLSKKVKSAMRTKQRNGSYVTCCLYGYKISPDNKHKMVIDPVAAPIVRRIFTDVIAGKSTSQIARELNAEGIPTPQQHKGVAQRKNSPAKPIWTHNRILDMIKNRKYTGCMVNHTRESMVIRAKSQRRVPQEEWIIHENAHEAIVTMEEFEAARAALRKVKPHTKKYRENVFPFYCAHCGRKLQRTFGTDDHFYCVTPYWNTEEELCKSVRWDRTDIEEVVLESLKGQLAIMTVEAVSKAESTVSQGNLLRQRLKALTAELEGGDGKKVQSYIDYREGRISREDYIAFRDNHEKRVAELKEQIAETEAEYGELLRNESQAKKEQELAHRTNAMDDETLKEMMYDAVERINVTDNQSIEIIWKFDDLFATA